MYCIIVCIACIVVTHICNFLVGIPWRQLDRRRNLQRCVPVTYMHTYIRTSIYLHTFFVCVLAFVTNSNQMSWNKICSCNYVTLHSLPMGSLLELPYPLSDFGSRW